MTFTPSAPHKKQRWLALLMILSLCLGLTATAALALDTTNPPSPTWTYDQGLADDQPGQKDLNAQAAVLNGADLWSFWTWDITKLNGGNTGDACSLFSTDSNDNIDFAVCVTIGGNPAGELDTRIYTCGDTRLDRCTNPELIVPSSGTYSTACEIRFIADNFHSGLQDTEAICHIDLAEVGGSTATRLMNTCSYPSQEPNSDPSDCVIELSIAASLSTTPSKIVTWSVTLNDRADLSPTGATGTVTFRLYSASDCLTGLIWTSDAATVTAGVALSSTAGDGLGNPDGANVRTNLTTPGAGTYYWTASYTPTAGSSYTAYTSPCGEATVVTAAS